LCSSVAVINAFSALWGCAIAPHTNYNWLAAIETAATAFVDSLLIAHAV
jgi:hypothetical protein